MAVVESGVPVKRIRDLLRLAKSDNQYEAAGARQRANELLRRYNVTESDIADKATETPQLAPGKDGNQRMELARVVAKSRGVTAKYLPISFTGYPDAAKDACQLYTALCRIVETNCETQAATSDSDRFLWRTCFWLGFIEAIQKQLDPEHGSIPKGALAKIVQSAQTPPDIERAAQAFNHMKNQLRMDPSSAQTWAENFKSSAHDTGCNLGNHTPVPAYRPRR